MAESKGRRIGVWIILILLFIGLMGFGATGLSGTSQTLARVGQKEVSLRDYALELDGQLRAFGAETGQRIGFAQAQQIGLDRAVLRQLLSARALDNAAAEMGISVGDANVATQLLEIPGFQGIDGQFDREAYAFTLERQGLSEADFEADLRDEMARTLLQAAVVAGIPDPEVYARTLADFALEERDFNWFKLTADDLADPVPAPTEADISAFYDANATLYTRPETKEITFVQLTPDMIQDEITLDEDALRALYEERIGDFVQPERRLVERLVMRDGPAAEEALAQIEAGGRTFEDLVADRGLDLADTDLGDVTREELAAAGDGVFAAGLGEVVGPYETSLGPAIFRVNAVLEAQEITFEEARPDLREELSLVRAQRVIDSVRGQITDLLAGGATLEDVAERTNMELGEIDWAEDVTDGIAAYAAFRDAAASTLAGAFPELLELEDGGLFALRVDAVREPAVQPLDEVRDLVAEDWTEAETQRLLRLQAEETAESIGVAGEFFPGLPTPRRETGLTRRAIVAGTPPEFLPRVFELDAGGVAVINDFDGVIVVQVERIDRPESDAGDLGPEAQAVADRAAAEIAQDIFDVYLAQVQASTEISVDQSALNAVNASFQ